MRRARSGRRRSRPRSAAPRGGTARAAMMPANRFWTLRVSASSSFDSSTTSGTSANSPMRYGSSSIRRVELDAPHALDEDPQRPVGDADQLVDDRRRADLVAGRPSRATRRSSFLTVTSASMRSPATTSSTSLIERSWPIASGVIDCGKTTVSFSGSTGSDRRARRAPRRRASGRCSSSLTTASRRSPRTIRIRPVRGRCASGSTIVSRPRS